MKRLTNLEFIEKSNRTHGFKYDYSKTTYINKRTKIDVICPIHGVFTQNAGSHIMGVGCPKCANVHRMNTAEFIDKAKQVHNNKYNYDLTLYKLSSKKIKIICPTHGIFEQKAGDHLFGKGCKFCNESKGEIKIKKILLEQQINFIPQHKFPDCKHKRLLPFDFYLPEHNTCIEYQGRQHYEPVKDFGGESEFKNILLRDKIKENYCADNGTILIKIKYTDDINLDFIK